MADTPEKTPGLTTKENKMPSDPESPQTEDKTNGAVVRENTVVAEVTTKEPTGTGDASQDEIDAEIVDRETVSIIDGMAPDTPQPNVQVIVMN